MAPRTGKPPLKAAPGLARRRRRNPPDARRARAACSGCGLLLSSQVLLRHQEEVLVDLALVDRHALFDTHPDHLLPVETELLRQFFGREVIRHPWLLFPERKNPPRTSRWRVRVHPLLWSSR